MIITQFKMPFNLYVKHLITYQYLLMYIGLNIRYKNNIHIPGTRYELTYVIYMYIEYFILLSNFDVSTLCDNVYIFVKHKKT